MNRTFTIALLLTAFLVGGLPGCGSSNPCDPLPGLPALFTLLDALAGTEVTVVGFITVDPGTFESSTGEVGFAIQEFEIKVLPNDDRSLLREEVQQYRHTDCR